MDWKNGQAILICVSLAGCAGGESNIPAPSFPNMSTVDHVMVAAPRGLIEGQMIELRPVPADAARDLVKTIQAACKNEWSGDPAGQRTHTRSGYPVNVYFEGAKGRLLRLGLSKQSVTHEAAQRHAYCDWDSDDYTQAIKALGLR